MATHRQQTQSRLQPTPVPTSQSPTHALAVGGSGMLAGAVRGLAAAGWRVSVVARGDQRLERLSAESPNIYPLVCDYSDEAAYEAALSVAFAERGAPTLAIVWIHGTTPEGPQHTAQVISRTLAEEQHGQQRAGSPGGSAPSRPGVSTEAPEEGVYRTPNPTPGQAGRSSRFTPHPRSICRYFHIHSSASSPPDAEVEHYRRACSLLSHIAYRAIILGRDPASGTWLEHEMICDGVLEAVTADKTLHWVGIR